MASSSISEPMVVVDAPEHDQFLLKLLDGAADHGIDVLVGQRVGNQTWPTDTALVAIVRGPRVFAPSADDPLDTGDELLFVASPDQEGELQRMLGHA